MRRIMSLISFALFLLLGVSLALLNPQTVTFDYFFNQTSLPLSFILSLSFLLGLFLAGLLLTTKLWSAQWQLRKSNKKLKQQDAELLQLKKTLNQLETHLELNQATEDNGLMLLDDTDHSKRA